MQSWHLQPNFSILTSQCIISKSISKLLSHTRPGAHWITPEYCLELRLNDSRANAEILYVSTPLRGALRETAIQFSHLTRRRQVANFKVKRRKGRMKLNKWKKDVGRNDWEGEVWKKTFCFAKSFALCIVFPVIVVPLSLSLISSLLRWHQQQKLFSSDWGFPLPDLFITGPRSLCKYPSSVSAFLFHSLCLSFSLSWSYSCTLNTFLVERSARRIERL